MKDAEHPFSSIANARINLEIKELWGGNKPMMTYRRAMK